MLADTRDLSAPPAIKLKDKKVSNVSLTMLFCMVNLIQSYFTNSVSKVSTRAMLKESERIGIS